MPDSTHHLKLSKLSAEYKALIEKHLKFYEQLEHSQVPIDTEERKHFQAAAKGLAQPKTKHEEAYQAYQRASKMELTAPSGKALELAKSQGILDSLKATLDEELLQIEERQDITEDEKAAMLINRFAVVCSAVAIQPLPFADIMILTPIQIFMAERIASVRGIKISESQAKDILIEVGKVVGLGMLAQQAAIGLYKTILPGLGGFMSIPLVYGLTYAIGRVLDYNYSQLRKGRKASSKELLNIFNQAKSEGKQEGKKHKNEVQNLKDDLS